MAGYQLTMIIGHVGHDPELRYTQSGVAVTSFSVAVTRKYKVGDERREDTTWFRVSAWRGLAETCNEYVKKGMQIMVTGRVSASAYTGQNGEARASLDLTAQDVQFLGQRGNASESTGYPSEPEDLPF